MESREKWTTDNNIRMTTIGDWNRPNKRNECNSCEYRKLANKSISLFIYCIKEYASWLLVLFSPALVGGKYAPIRLLLVYFILLDFCVILLDADKNNPRQKNHDRIYIEENEVYFEDEMRKITIIRVWNIKDSNKIRSSYLKQAFHVLINLCSHFFGFFSCVQVGTTAWSNEILLIAQYIAVLQ